MSPLSPPLPFQALRCWGDTRGKTMRWCPELVASLWGALWLVTPLVGGRPVCLEKVRGDTKNLTRTLSTRIQQLQLLPLPLRIPELEELPGEGAPEGLVAMAQRLQFFQFLLTQLATAGHQPLTQLANDLENLASLLVTMATQLGCPQVGLEPPPLMDPPSEVLVRAPHTVTTLALGRLRGCLDGIATQLGGHLLC
ncbi:leptin [Melanerpes formicivorus]|uniref:leptin n=1 Tax=Melanerpes formicivorus TaxID=211600 RepID=UPI00358F4A9C